MNSLPEERPTMVMPRAENITNQHLATLLSVLNNAVGPILTGKLGEEAGANPLDGGVKSALELVAIKTCDRLNAILDDSSRWQLNLVREMEASIRDYYKQGADHIRAQLHALNEADTPHAKYRPTLVRLKEEEWAAILGTLTHGLVGIGRSPEEAIRDFDEIFKGELPAPTIEWLQNRALMIKQQLEQNETTVDQNGTGTTEKIEGGRPHSAGDIAGFETDDQGSANPTGTDSEIGGDPR